MDLTQGIDVVESLVDGAAELDPNIPPATGLNSQLVDEIQKRRVRSLKPVTHLKDSSEVALRSARSMRVFINFPQLTLYR